MAKQVLVIEGTEELIATLRAMGAAAEHALREAAEAGAELLRSEMEQKAPGPHIVTELRGASAGRVSIAIGPDKEHWYYQFAETGAQSHEIEPHVREALKFADGNFAARVSHPGMAAEPFIRPTMDEKGQAAARAVGAQLMLSVEGAIK